MAEYFESKCKRRSGGRTHVQMRPLSTVHGEVPAYRPGSGRIQGFLNNPPVSFGCDLLDIIREEKGWGVQSNKYQSHPATYSQGDSD